MRLMVSRGPLCGPLGWSTNRAHNLHNPQTPCPRAHNLYNLDFDCIFFVRNVTTAPTLYPSINMRLIAALVLGFVCGAEAFTALSSLALRQAPSLRAGSTCRAPALAVNGVTMQNKRGNAATPQGVGQRRQASTQKGPVGNAPIIGRREPEGPLSDDPALPMIQDIVRAMDERKAGDIWAARVAHLTYTTSFIVNCGGASRPALQAIAANVRLPARHSPLDLSTSVTCSWQFGRSRCRDHPMLQSCGKRRPVA